MRRQPTRLAGCAISVATATFALTGCRIDSPVAPAATAERIAATSRQATTSGRILFRRSLPTAPHVFSMDEDGTDVRMISMAFTAAVDAAWAPDGKRILVSAAMTDPAVPLSVFSLEPDGTGLTRLTIPPADCSDTDPQALGKRIVFLRTCANASAAIVMEADGTGLTTLVDNVGSQPGPSPKGSELAYSKGGDLWLLDLVTGTHTRLTNTPTLVESRPAFSPNGKRIAFTQSDGSGFQIFTMDPDGTMITLVQANGFGAVWSPDGKRIAFTRLNEITDVFVSNADGTGVTNLTQTPSEFETPQAWARF
jgi:Tol biopolymer transport system component